ncbi:MAG: PilZ domain-containing protein [Gammaproteobacteria bacterium]|nr:PilZ domain-containing protein [Gammaproteobacteria bacterium]
MLGSRNYIEKRDFMRMAINCPVSYQVADSDLTTKSGNCINLSARGILFQCDDKYPEGTELRISVQPQLSISPPFNAKMKVIRVDWQGEDNSYCIAGTIEMVG